MNIIIKIKDSAKLSRIEQLAETLNAVKITCWDDVIADISKE